MRHKIRILTITFIAIGSYWLAAQHSPKPTTNLAPKPIAIINDTIDLNRITYYQAVPEQTDSDPHISSCGPNIPNQVAVSRDLFRSTLDCGDTVLVWSNQHGYLGEFIVWDTMHPRFSKTLDILTVNPYDWGKTAGYAVITKEVQQ